MSEPAPGTGVTYDPKAESIEAGIVTPAKQDTKPPKPGIVIPQLEEKQLENELEELDVSEFIKKHTDSMDANVMTMARVLRMTEQEVRDVQRELGYQLPNGA